MTTPTPAHLTAKGVLVQAVMFNVPAVAICGRVWHPDLERVPTWDDLCPACWARVEGTPLEAMYRAALDGGVDAPKRIQRRRTKGWRMPNGAVYVGRPTAWGNPWTAGDPITLEWPDRDTPYGGFVREMTITPEIAVALYRAAFTPDAAEIREQLAGKDLACWCPLDQPCHADVLLELANGGDRP